MAVFSAATAVSEANLNKMIVGDGTGSGIWKFAFNITSDGGSDGVDSFTVSGPLDEGVSVYAYDTTNNIITIEVANRTLTALNTVVTARCGVGSVGTRMNLYAFSSGRIQLVGYSHAAAVIDLDSTALIISGVIITTA